MKSYYSLFIFLSINSVLFAQWHDNTWILGYNDNGTIIDFSESPPIVSEFSLGLKLLANVSVSNSLGEFLFYTNAIYIHDNEDNFMEGSDTLNAGELVQGYMESGYPLSDAIMALPDYENEQIINLIHRRIESHPQVTIIIPDILISQVDMSLNGGKGKVVFKNEIVKREFFYDAAAATRHANGRDWWIISPHYDKSHFFRFLLTPDGITDTLTQIIGHKPAFPDTLDGEGQNKFSPDGSKFVDFDMWNGLRIMDFDRCSGTLSNYRLIKFAEKLNAGSGVAISPNSRFLFIDTYDYIFQYDLNAADIKGSVDTVSVSGELTMPPNLPAGFLRMQLGPDGKIYVLSAETGKHFHVIHQPNKKGTACDVRQYAIELPNLTRGESPYFPNYRLGPIDGSGCDTLGIDNRPLAHYTHETDSVNTLSVTFTDNSFYEPTDWHWEFDDGKTSDEINPIHVFEEAGIYNVCLTASNANDSDTFCREIELMPTSTENDILNDFEFSVTPNPASEQVFLSFRSEKMRDLKFELINISGQIVRELNFQTETFKEEILLKDFSGGTYFYRLTEKDKTLKNGKLVIIK